MTKSGVLPRGIKLYLFGSALTTREPQDIDLLLVYDVSKFARQDIIGIRKALGDELLALLDRPVDICLMSEDEAQTNTFIKDEGAILVIG